VSAGAVRERPGRPLPKAPATSVKLPEITEVAAIPAEQVPAVLIQLAALQVALASRLPASLPSVPSTEAQNWVTAKEVAKATSLRQGRIYELARTGRIPVKRIGKKQVRFDLAAVRESLR
jgi:excisionase family DNA binding protein